MRKHLRLLFISIVILTACNKMKRGDGDSFYIIHKNNSGPTIKEGDYLAISLKETTEEDSIIFSSYDADIPVYLLREKSFFKGDFYQSLGLLSEGDSATFKINIDSLVAKMEKPRPRTKGKYLLYTVQIRKIIPRGKLDDITFNANIDAYKQVEAEFARKKEEAKFKNYITSNNLKPIVRASGLNYIITQQGKGSVPATGDLVTVNYTAKFTSGKIFETSYPDVAKKHGLFDTSKVYQPLELLVQGGQNPSGFEEAISLFPAGTKADLIIPSKLAYGAPGRGIVGPYTPLVCDIEIISIKSKGKTN